MKITSNNLTKASNVNSGMNSKSQTMKNSPRDDSIQPVIYKEYTDTEISNLDDVQKLKKLFLIYTNNEKNMSSQKFLRILLDAQIIDKSFDIRYADILYVTENKSKQMQFDSFCEILVKISEIKFPNDYLLDQNRSLDRLLNKFLFPLLNKVITPSKQFFIEEKIERINFDFKIKDIIERNFELFRSIYEKYFPWETLNISNSQKKNLSFKSFEKFLFDFEICPNLISRIKAYELFEETFLNGKSIFKIFAEEKWISMTIGTSFSSLYFIIMIYLISISSYFFVEHKRDEYECFWLIIEKIINSQALKNMENYTDLIRIAQNFISYNYNISSKDSSFNTNNKKTFNNGDNPQLNLNKSSDGKESSMSFSSNKNPRSPEKDVNSSNFKTNYDENIEIDKKFIEKHKIVLLTLYKYYCNLTNCTNQIYLNNSCFLRLMKDSKILEINDKESTSSSIEFPFKLSIKSTVNNPLSEKNKSNFLSYNQINLLFSKFSSENDNTINDSLNNKQNYLYYTSNFYKFKTSKHSLAQDQNKVFSNKKLSFNGFMKILVCISNRIFNPALKGDVNNCTSKLINIKPINIDLLLSIEPHDMYNYLENLISLYFVPIYTEVKSIFENEFSDFQLLHDIINDELITLFVSKFNVLLLKIYNLCTGDKNYLFFEEFMKFCKEFEIFPDYLQKNRLYTLFVHFVKDFDSMIIQGNCNYYIDFEKFVVLLLFCSLDSNIGGTNNYIEKIVIFFDRMLHSEGIKRYTKLSGNGKLTYDFSNTLNYFKTLLSKPPTVIKSKTFKELIANK